ncbi:hypothetical protein ACQEU8_00520 [Streptomyces sp. CA-250714]|uniref:hypothetical protein n=1 Tax=Streptomyces sp. CA-250714 TaxID=3240060 RepID=UPI003D9219C5
MAEHRRFRLCRKTQAEAVIDKIRVAGPGPGRPRIRPERAVADIFALSQIAAYTAPEGSGFR